jgi:hypothetical protein
MKQQKCFLPQKKNKKIKKYRAKAFVLAIAFAIFLSFFFSMH